MPTFSWSRTQPAEVLEEARSYRFRPEWRPLLLQYLGLAPGMQVLEVCCGPGTLAPYLAEGIAPGTVTGLDLDPDFIGRAREKAARSGTRGVEYVLGDACDLPFADHSFDAVTSYTGIGILPDPERGVAEMLRVCRPGGTVSVVEPAVGAGGASGGLEEAEGASLYPGAAEYQALLARFRAVESAWLLPARRRAEQIGNRRWPVAALFGLLGRAGLRELRVDAWGYCTAPDDARVAPERRQAVRQAEFAGMVRWLRELQDGPECAVLEEHGFARGDLARLIELAGVRHRWLLEHPLYDWTAGVSLVMAGRK